MLRYKRLKLHF